LKKTILDFITQHHVKNRILLLLLLGIVVHLILPQISSLEKSWQVLVKMNLWLVGLAFISEIICYSGYGYMLQQSLAIAKQAQTLLRSTLIVLGANSVGMVAGGVVGNSAAVFRWTSQDDGDLEGSTLASLLPSLFNNLMLVILSVFGLLHLLVVHDLTKFQIISFSLMLLILAFLISLFILAVRQRQRAVMLIDGWLLKLAQVRHQAHDSETTRRQLMTLFSAWDELKKGKWEKVALGAVINSAFDLLTLYILFTAAGQNIQPEVLLTGYGLPLLLGKMAFIIPGGVGVVESSMAALYSGMGIPHATIVVVILSYRLISFWIPGLLGFPIAAYLQTTFNHHQLPPPKKNIE
jgi:glycosyltransferase 2 family protein